jgi:tetratricopeptide (TPR) repeat protein
MCASEHVAQQSSSGTSSSKPKPQTPTDPALINWESKDRYYLTVAASRTAGQDTDLPYAKVDGNKVSSVLQAKGYKKLETLRDKTATRENFIESLKRIRTLNENGLVVVYYSGHGAIDFDGRDLWLQLYGQRYFGESQGLAVSELIRTARGGTYKGELVVIIDACYSGQGAWTKSLNLNEMENTLIFASNSRTQSSLPIDVSPGETMSAFTYYLLKGVTDDWEAVDERQQGIILYEDLRTYIEVKLNELLVQNGDRDKQMVPEISGHPGKIWAAFDIEKAKNLRSLLRRAIGFRHYLGGQIPNLLQQGQLPTLSPPVIPAEARVLAQRVPPTADPYTKALQAIAEAKPSEALPLLDQAEILGSADLADIHQARGNAMVYLGRLVEGKDWYEKALKANRRENPELLEESGMVFFMLSDLDGAAVLLKQAVGIRERTPKEISDLAGDLMYLSFIEFLQGNFKEAESSLKRVQLIDPKVLDAEEAGSSVMPLFMLIVIKFVQGEIGESQKLATQFEKVAASKLDRDDPLRMIALLLLAFIHTESGNKTEVQTRALQFVESWEQVIDDNNSEKLSTYIGFVIGISTCINKILGSSSELAKRVNVLSGRSLDLIKNQHGPSSPQFALALFTLGNAYAASDNNVQAESLLLDAIKISEMSLGRGSALTGMMYGSLGRVYVELGKYSEAESAFQKSLTIAETTTGRTGMFALLAVEDFAHLYEHQKKYDDAVRQYERAIEISNVIWPNQTMSAGVMEDIAAIRYKQKRYPEAEALYKRSLAAKEKTFGSQHQELVSILNHLGSVYFRQQKYGEAESVISRALALLEGEKTPQVENLSKSLLWLSEVYLARRDFQKANKFAKRFDEVGRKISGNDDRDSVVAVLTQVATYYIEQAKVVDAHRFYQRVLSLYENETDNLRPVVAVHLYNIAQFYEIHREYETAENLFKRAIFIDEKTLGKNDIQVAIDLEALADVYRQTGRYTEAEALYERSIPIREKAGDDARLAITLRNQGLVYLKMSRYDQAQAPLAKALSIWDGISKPDIAEVAECLAFLAVVAYETKADFTEAERLIRRAISLDEQDPGNRFLLAEDLRTLATIFRFQRRYNESEGILKRARDILTRDYSATEPATSKIQFNLILVYRSQAKYKEAESLLKQTVRRQRTASEQAELASWMEHYALALRYMKRESEALDVAGWAKLILGGRAKN